MMHAMAGPIFIQLIDFPLHGSSFPQEAYC